MPSCELCGKILEVGLRLTGGCEGYHDDRTFCQCPDREAEVFMICRECPKCRRKNRMIRHVPGLTDVYGIARFIKMHLEGKF